MHNSKGQEMFLFLKQNFIFDHLLMHIWKSCIHFSGESIFGCWYRGSFDSLEGYWKHCMLRKYIQEITIVNQKADSASGAYTEQFRKGWETWKVMYDFKRWTIKPKGIIVLWNHLTHPFFQCISISNCLVERLKTLKGKLRMWRLFYTRHFVTIPWWKKSGNGGPFIPLTMLSFRLNAYFEL